MKPIGSLAIEFVKPIVRYIFPEDYRFQLKRFIYPFWYSGNHVICPCCKANFRSFLPFGIVEQRPNALCPVCGTLERHRLMYLYLKQKTNLFTDCLRVLHVAPEASLERIFRNMPNLYYVTTDLVSPRAMVHMDITQFASKSNSYDVVLCSHVLEHIPDDQQAMRELYRVLKPGGWAILQVPLEDHRSTTFEDFTLVSPQERERAFGQHDHVRVYGRDYVDRLSQSGFTVHVEPFAQTLGSENIRKYGLDETERIYFCTKNK